MVEAREWRSGLSGFALCEGFALRSRLPQVVCPLGAISTRSRAVSSPRQRRARRSSDAGQRRLHRQPLACVDDGEERGVLEDKADIGNVNDDAQLEPGKKSEHNSEGKGGRFNRIVKQVEYWFSEPSLRWDDFLHSAMDENGRVKLGLILRFNRTIALAATSEEVMAACEHSALIEVTPPADGEPLTEALLRPTGDMEFLLDDPELNKRVVIAHSFPTYVTGDDIVEEFSLFGAIRYRKIPRTRLRRLVDRAVIEYEDETAAQECVKRLGTTADGEPLYADEYDRTSRKVPCLVMTKPAWDEFKSRAFVEEASPLCTVLRLDGVPKRTAWRVLFDMCTDGLEVKYLNLLPQPEVRYSSREDAEEARRRFGSTQSTGAISARFLTRGEEMEYWKRFFTSGSHSPPDTQRNRLVRIAGIAGCSWDDVYNSIDAIARIVYLNYNPGDDCCTARMIDYDSAVQLVQDLSREGSVVAGAAVTDVRLLGNEEAAEYWNSVSGKKRVVKVDGLDEHCTWHGVFEDVRRLGYEVYLLYNTGKPSCLLRVGNEGKAKSLVNVLTKPGVTLSGSRIESAVVLSEDEERELWRLPKQRLGTRRSDEEEQGVNGLANSVAP